MQIINRHIHMVYWTCHRDLNDALLAEDATQLVFVLLASKARTLRRGVSISGWLFETARFVARNSNRKQAQRQDGYPA